MLAVAAQIAAAADGGGKVYDKPANGADETTVVDNGNAGAVVFGTYPDERIDLNVAGCKGVAQLTVHHSVPLKSKVTGYRRGLDASKGTAYMELDRTEGVLKQEMYASGPDSAIVIRYGAEVPLNCTIVLTSEYVTGEVKSFDDRITLTGKLPGKGGEDGPDFITILKVIPGKGNITTNPDASLTLNYMQGATLIVTTVQSGRGGTPLPAGVDSAAELATLRVFRTSLRLEDGFDRYLVADASRRGSAEEGFTASVGGVAVQTVQRGESAEFADVVWTNEEGMEHTVLRTWPGQIEFLPTGLEAWGDGEAEDLQALGLFRVSFRWDKGKVSGGNVTYVPKDYTAPPVKVTLLLNGEPHEVEFAAGQTVPIENFVDLVRPFIQ